MEHKAQSISSSISKYEKGKQLITLLSNILLLVGVIFDFVSFKDLFLPIQYQIRVLMLFMIITSLILIVVDLRRFYYASMLIQVYALSIVTVLDCTLFSHFSALINTSPSEFFMRGIFFLTPHLCYVGFVTSKKHTFVLASLVVILISGQLYVGVDEFLKRSIGNFYMNLIGLGSVSFFLVGFVANFIRDITNANKLVVEKSNEINDSLNYAELIQRANFPSEQKIQQTLPDCFVLNMPKDIVSGDFCFFRPLGSTVFIAAADCTGHGVPGALLSMLANEKLNAAVSLSNNTSEILSSVNQQIKLSLSSADNTKVSNDGMDIALCSLEKDRMVLNYSAANRPIWIMRDGQSSIEEVKATKASIGGYTTSDQHYQTHEISLSSGDTFYIFTDGYADTFGGKASKKLMSRRFKEILINLRSKTMAEQKVYLHNFINDWKSGNDQCDDILVIGVRV